MGAPDGLSRRVARAIDPEMAERIFNDLEFQDECRQAGVDGCALVRNLLLTARERVKGADSELTAQNMLTLLDELTRRKIKFVLIGGLAGRVYGSNYSTIDLDICHSRDPENLQLLADMLKELGSEFRRAPVHVPPALKAETLTTEMDFVFTTRLGNFDLIGEFTGVGSYQQASEGAIPVKMIRRTVRVLSLPKLMAAKLSTGRPKDSLVYKEMAIVRRFSEKLEAVFVT
jgi:hypothetical protein